MNLPASQLVHVPWLALGCTVPGLHGLCANEPVEHEEPAGQLMHWSLWPRLGVLLYVPSLHESGVDPPSKQYEPPGHSKHELLSPVLFMNLPASHLSQLPCPDAGCMVPGGHSV